MSREDIGNFMEMNWQTKIYWLCNIKKCELTYYKSNFRYLNPQFWASLVTGAMSIFKLAKRIRTAGGKGVPPCKNVNQKPIIPNFEMDLNL